jgi:phosphohistidine phosphatase
MSTDLYFLRHAVAVKSGFEGHTDEERPLTAQGREKMISAVRGMKKLKITLDALWTSPLIRAVQTAEIVQEHLSFNSEIVIEKLLLPGGSLEELLKKLKPWDEKSVMVVGHEPTLSSWIQDLLGGDPTGSIQLKKGALCHLRLTWVGTRAAPELIALLQPRVLRQLA